MLKQRVLTALVLVLGLGAALAVFPQWAWLCLVAVVSALGAHEWARLNPEIASRALPYSLACGGATLLLGMLGGVGGLFAGSSLLLGALYLASLVMWLLLVPAWMRGGWQFASPSSKALVGLVLLVPSGVALAHLRDVSLALLLAALVLVWIADIAAYFTGRAFGKTKLAPSISPGKTREGAAGAVAGVIVAGSLMFFAGFPESRWVSVVWLVPALVAYTALSIVGDLFESLVKRSCGAKDSGTLLPGHGGVLDRIDSLTSTLPLAGLIVLILQFLS